MSTHTQTDNILANAPRFGNALRLFRIRAGLTQEELAERAELSADAISSLERGVRRHPLPRTVRALATALRLSKQDQATFAASAKEGSDIEKVDSATVSTADARRTTVPVPPTAMIGREREVAAALALLGQPEIRLLTLIGPGGVGKTRLALAVAATASDHVSDAYFVDLSALNDPAFVASVIAHALGLREQGSRESRDNLAAFINDQTVLLVLDNFEHLTAAAALVSDLLAGCPRLVVLATSRAALRVRGEHEFPVSPLAVPDETTDVSSPMAVGELLAFEAVSLFVERALAVNPSLDLSPEGVRVIAEICRQLDGLPLAIELAAARTRALPPAALLPRLSNRLALLTEGPVDAPERQRTLRAAIDWSYDLLSSDEQALFRRLSVFTGGFTLDAVAAISYQLSAISFDESENGASSSNLSPTTHHLSPSSVLDGIESLASKSLLRRKTGAGAGAPRFELLETVREYGLEQLTAHGEEAAVRDAHAVHFLAFAERAEEERIGAEQPLWLGRLEAEHANLRQALAWLSAKGEDGLALRLAAKISWFWWYRGHYAEGRARLAALLARPGAAADEEAWALAMTESGLLAHSQGDSASAIQLHDDAVAAWRRLENPVRLVEGLYLQGLALLYGGDARAIPVLSECQTIARTFSHPGWLVCALWASGRAQYFEGNLPAAAEAFEEALPLARDLGNSMGMAWALWGLGDVAWDRGDETRAVPLLREAMAHFRHLGDAWSTILCLERLAMTRAGDDPHAAARLLGAADAWRDAVGIPRPPAEQERHGRAVGEIRATLGDDDFQAEWNDGLTLSPEQAIVAALSS